MNYDIRITISIGNLTMGELVELQEALESLIEEYETKTKNIQIGDAGQYIRQPFKR